MKDAGLRFLMLLVAITVAERGRFRSGHFDRLDRRYCH